MHLVVFDMIFEGTNGKVCFLINLRCYLGIQKVPIDVSKAWTSSRTTSEKVAIQSIISKAQPLACGIVDILGLSIVISSETTVGKEREINFNLHVPFQIVILIRTRNRLQRRCGMEEIIVHSILQIPTSPQEIVSLITTTHL